MVERHLRSPAPGKDHERVHRSLWGAVLIEGLGDQGCKGVWARDFRSVAVAMLNPSRVRTRAILCVVFVVVRDLRGDVWRVGDSVGGGVADRVPAASAWVDVVLVRGGFAVVLVVARVVVSEALERTSGGGGGEIKGEWDRIVHCEWMVEGIQRVWREREIGGEWWTSSVSP